ncbi:hypothetical protein BR93DRAFT_142489 [Coniochaeta sp. PMI_546]|nr:hypothetical protein BR93DRAFT_142489 [Coniochaeta sp. PMI_546]
MAESAGLFENEIANKTIWWVARAANVPRHMVAFCLHHSHQGIRSPKIWLFVTFALTAWYSVWFSWRSSRSMRKVVQQTCCVHDITEGEGPGVRKMGIQPVRHPDIQS